jgi:hypothetical protein
MRNVHHSILFFCLNGLKYSLKVVDPMYSTARGIRNDKRNSSGAGSSVWCWDGAHVFENGGITG